MKAALVLTLLAAGSLTAQTPFPTRPPAPARLRPSQFPPFQEAALPNGMTLLLVENHEQPSLSVTLSFRAGSAYDPAGKEGLSAIVAELLTGPGEPQFRGTLTFLDNAVDRATGTIVARATIANPDRRLLPGQYVRVRLRLGEQPGALLVPQVAIGSSQLGKFVYVVGAGSKVEQRLVTTGATDGDLVVVAKGLAEGDSVIVGNLQKIGAGAPVQPMPAGKTGS